MEFFSNAWGFFVKYSGVFASVPALIYLSNLLIIKYIKKDELVLQKDLNIKLEKEKADLTAKIEKIKAQHTQENEQLKSELSHQNSRLQIAYSGVYKDQVEALTKLYSLILDFEAAIYSRRDTSNTDPNKYNKPSQIINDFKIEFYKHSIFIPESLDQKIMKIIGFGSVHSLYDKFELSVQKGVAGNIAESDKLFEEARKDAQKLIELREDFKREIRKVLAVD